MVAKDAYEVALESAKGELSDSESFISDDEDDNVFIPDSNSNVQISDNFRAGIRKKYKREHEKLKDSLSSGFPETRTRSGRR